MNDKTQNPLDGQVSITIDDELRFLNPTPGAALRLCKIYGGFAPVLGKLQQLDLEVMATVIRLGLSLNDKESRGLQDKVFHAGVVNLLEPTVEFVTVLMNGGRSNREEEDSETTEAPEKTPGNA